MFDAYALLPIIARIRSELAPTEESPLGVLANIASTLDQEVSTTVALIKGLPDLVSTEDCPGEYLPLLAMLVGIPLFDSLTEDEHRLFITFANHVWKIKGTRQSWKFFLDHKGYTNYYPHELWKTKLHEDVNYSRTQDYQHTMKAARVDIILPENVDDGTDRGLMIPEVVEVVRPAHVLLRQPVRFGRDTDTETPEEPDEIHQVGMYRGGEEEVFDFYVHTDDYETWTECELTGCETVCTVGCTALCESVCQFGPCELTACEGYCQVNCQVECEYQCQTACQGTCENETCQATTCQIGCQVACQPGVE